MFMLLALKLAAVVMAAGFKVLFSTALLPLSYWSFFFGVKKEK